RERCIARPLTITNATASSADTIFMSPSLADLSGQFFHSPALDMDRRVKGLLPLCALVSSCQRCRQLPQKRSAVPAPGTAMHACERHGLLTRQTFEHGLCLRRVGIVVHRLPEPLARSKDVGFRKGNITRAALGEQIPTQQRAGPELH